MTVNTRELDSRARDHLEARSAQDKAALTEVQILVSVANYLEKPEDVGSYLLAFETAYKEKAFNPDSLKVIKSNIKTFLEFSKGWRKEQADWTAEQVASESERIASDAKSLQQLSKGARESIKDSSTADAGKDDLSPEQAQAPTVDQMTAKLAKLAQSFADAGASKADINKAIAALAKLAK